MDAELRGLVADHVADLRRCAVLLDPVPQLAKTAAEIRKAADELEAALSVAHGQGFVMVPRVPTYQMAEAMGVKWESGEGFPRRYTAMLAAAPAQPDGVE